MTEQDWKQYFDEKPKDVVEFIKNLTEATRKGWIDSIDADITRQLINFELRQLNVVIEKRERIEAVQSAEQWKG